jgi:hypothetical protein
MHLVCVAGEDLLHNRARALQVRVQPQRGQLGPKRFQVVGLTGGVCWELQKTFEVVPLNRLILSLQPEKSIWRRRQLVRQFHETNILPVPINMVGDFPFVYFDENRTPHGATRLTGALKELRIGQDVEV